MAEKANIIVKYEKEWFDKNFIVAALMGVTNVKNAFSMEPEFARFQNEEDAKVFRNIMESMSV